MHYLGLSGEFLLPVFHCSSLHLSSVCSMTFLVTDPALWNKLLKKSRGCLCYRQSLCISKGLLLRWLCDLVEDVFEPKNLCLDQYFFGVFLLVTVYIVSALAQASCLEPLEKGGMELSLWVISPRPPELFWDHFYPDVSWKLNLNQPFPCALCFCWFSLSYPLPPVFNPPFDDWIIMVKLLPLFPKRCSNIKILLDHCNNKLSMFSQFLFFLK